MVISTWICHFEVKSCGQAISHTPKDEFICDKGVLIFNQDEDETYYGIIGVTLRQLQYLRFMVSYWDIRKIPFSYQLIG